MSELNVNKLAVVVTTPPYSNLTITALDYVETALSLGVDVIGVFFYQDGAIQANSKVKIASDEYQAIQHWARLHQQYQLPLHLCITAAEKRGIECESASTETQSNSNEIFTISGLGELVELATNATRLVQF
jgi:tRNA 2-thiouridine synthesizing protein D